MFLNLPAIAPDDLERQGGFFGWVLRLVQQRKARPAAFRQLLAQVVGHLEAMPAQERARWRELLSYVHALIYHERNTTEIPTLQQTIQHAVQSKPHQQEVAKMGKTYAEHLKQEGHKEGVAKGMQEGIQKGIQQGELRARRQTLLRLLRQRFQELPPDTVEIIERTDSSQQLDGWLDRVLTAATLEEMEIQ